MKKTAKFKAEHGKFNARNKPRLGKKYLAKREIVERCKCGYPHGEEEPHN